MSRHGTLLPLPDAPVFAELIEAWPDYSRWYLRSEWLGEFEAHLRPWYPNASSADRKLTARHYAPFPLKDGPNVP